MRPRSNPIRPLLLASTLTLTACAEVPVDPAPAVPAPLPAQAGIHEVPFGLASIEPRSDVADLTHALRHVLYPDGQPGAYGPAGEAAAQLTATGDGSAITHR